MMYDITQEVFAGRVYPGDPRPRFTRLKSFAAGDQSQVTEITMQVHAATHIDAPIHRVAGGCGAAELPLEKCIGPCEVVDYADRGHIAKTAIKRILLKGCEEMDEQTARLLVEKGVVFVAVQGQSVGSRAVHKVLLEHEVVVLEGAVLHHVPVGQYMLFAPPVPLGGCDGAPCRAVLVDINGAI